MEAKFGRDLRQTAAAVNRGGFSYVKKSKSQRIIAARSPSLFARLPKVFFEVDDKVFAHFDAFALEQLRLNLGAAERERRRESAFAVDDAVAGDDAGARIGVQCISDRARRARRGCTAS